MTEDEKRKAQDFQEMNEDFYNLVRKEKEQLLNTAVRDLVNFEQILRVDAKEYQLISVVVGEHQLLKVVNLEDSQGKEGWLIINAEEENDEERVELLEEITNEMEDLWHELSLLENRLAK